MARHGSLKLKACGVVAFMGANITAVEINLRLLSRFGNVGAASVAIGTPAKHSAASATFCLFFGWSVSIVHVFVFIVRSFRKTNRRSECRT